MKLEILIGFLLLNLPLKVSAFIMPSTENRALPNEHINLLRLDDEVDLFKDILEDFKETPSNLYKSGQIKAYLSAPIAIKLRADLGKFRDSHINSLHPLVCASQHTPRWI